MSQSEARIQTGQARDHTKESLRNTKQAREVTVDAAKMIQRLLHDVGGLSNQGTWGL
jgi:hypothetical protein